MLRNFPKEIVFKSPQTKIIHEFNQSPKKSENGEFFVRKCHMIIFSREICQQKYCPEFENRFTS